MKSILHRPWYAFLFSTYPALALFAFNFGQVTFSDVIQSILLSAFMVALFLVLFRLIYRSWQRAAFASLAWAVLFYTYGHIYDQIWSRWKPAHLGTWMEGAWAFLALLVLGLVGLKKVKFEKAASTLNILCLALVIYPVAQVLWLSVPDQRRSAAKNAPLETLQPPRGQTLPDIYYFILDSYGSADLLRQAYAYDNTSFIQGLENSGFYVAACSQSNYVRTEISLGSSLNMQYLQDLDPALKPENMDQNPIWADMRYNAVSLDLKTAGYKTVAFATGFAWSEFDHSDVYIAPRVPLLELNEFDDLLLRSSVLRTFMNSGGIDLDQVEGERSRERTLLIFDSMNQLAHMPGPKFVFIHLIAPHPPFVFGPDGSPTNPGQFLNTERMYTTDSYTRGYLNMLAFINQKVLTAVTTLIHESPTRPVIILQGDHGPWLQTGSDEFKILNAYYLPGHTDKLYPTISPVNTFRLILDAYLGANYPLLKDQSYFSPIPHIYDFSPIANPCEGK